MHIGPRHNQGPSFGHGTDLAMNMDRHRSSTNLGGSYVVHCSNDMVTAITPTFVEVGKTRTTDVCVYV